jgi:hypothetical protein
MNSLPNQVISYHKMENFLYNISGDGPFDILQLELQAVMDNH